MRSRREGEENMNKWKRILAAAMTGMICLSFTACGKDGGENKDLNGTKEASAEDGEGSGSRGRLVEHIQDGPKGELLDIQVVKDGNLRAFTSTGIYDSPDRGDSWKPWDAQPKELSDGFETSLREDGDTGLRISAAAIGSDGSLFYAALRDEAEYKVIRPDGSEQILNLELPAAEPDQRGMTALSSFGSRIYAAAFAENGDLFCTDNLNIYQIDADSLTVKHTYEVELTDYEGMTGGFEFCTSGDKLYVIVQEYQPQGSSATEESGASDIKFDIEVRTYQTDTFENTEDEDVLSDFLSGSEGGAGDFANLTLPGASDHALYFVNKNGIYRYDTQGTIVEKIFNGSFGQMSNPAVMLSIGAAQDKDHLYLSDTDGRIIRYEYDPDAASSPEKSLAVYTLYDNRAVRQAISAFQTQNPDVLVKLEVGITGENAVTRADALKTLNTSIMAGDGPDILLMDGMPIESYMEKGLLADMSDVIEKVDQSDGLFKNILGCYQKKGEYLAVPTRFAVPVLMAENDFLSQTETLGDLADALTEYGQEYPDKSTFMENIAASNLLLILMPASSPAWINQDGTLNQKALKQFFTDAKRIQDIRQPYESFEYTASDAEFFNQAPFMTSAEYLTTESGFTDSEMYLANIRRGMDLCALISKINTVSDGSYKLAPGQAEGTYIPMSTIGISAKSTKTELAEEFCTFLLQDAQDFTLEDSWPVNIAAFDKKLLKPEDIQEGMRTIESDIGEGTFEMEYTWPSKEQADAFKKLAGELKTPAVTDEFITRTVFEEGTKCMNGESSVSDTVDKITQKVNLYLAE